MVGGMSDLYPAVIVPVLPTDTWQPGSTAAIETQLDLGWRLVADSQGRFPPQPQPTDAPSWTAQINQSGGGQLWSADNFALMTFADQRAFLKAGGIGSWPRNWPTANFNAMQLYLNRNSHEYLAKGKPFVDACLAWQAANP